MGETARTAQRFGRRKSPRLRLGMPARLVTLDRTYPVMLENLSEGGAKIVLPVADDFVVGVLRWMDYHGFADVVWREDCAVGLQFDKPISAEMLEATRLYDSQLTARMRQGGPGWRGC